MREMSSIANRTIQCTNMFLFEALKNSLTTRYNSPLITMACVNTAVHCCRAFQTFRKNSQQLFTSYARVDGYLSHPFKLRVCNISCTTVVKYDPR